MDITEVPFNKFVGIARPEGEPGYLLQLCDSTDYENHLGTVHASAQLALAEATSGEHLMKQFPELGQGVLAVVRRMEAKFRNPLKGKIMSRARISKEEADKITELLQTKVVVNHYRDRGAFFGKRESLTRQSLRFLQKVQQRAS